MKINSITEKSDRITILVNGSYEYNIPKREYDREIDGVSDWIHQLLEKKWADKDSLYKVGALLSRHTKDSKIDWESTFYMVERMFFIREIQGQEKLKSDGPEIIGSVEIHSSKSIHDSMMRTIEIGRETHTEENKILMNERVQANMKKYRFK